MYRRDQYILGKALKCRVTKARKIQFVSFSKVSYDFHYLRHLHQTFYTLLVFCLHLATILAHRGERHFVRCVFKRRVAKARKFSDPFHYPSWKTEHTKAHTYRFPRFSPWKMERTAKLSGLCHSSFQDASNNMSLLSGRQNSREI